MDKNLKFVVYERIKRTIENLEKNNISAYRVENEEEALKKLGELIPEGSTIGIGGSMTLLKLVPLTLSEKVIIRFWTEYKEGLTPAEMKEIFRKDFSLMFI